MNVAADMCVYTNREFITLTMDDVGKSPSMTDEQE
jgi:hypothetical protein